VNISDILVPIIDKYSKNTNKKLVWLPTSRHINIQTLTPDEVGDVGEELIFTTLKNSGNYDVTWSKKTKNKEYDVKAKNKTNKRNHRIEVKTATLGNSTSSFQHDGLKKHRKFDNIIFVDIGPDDMYITCSTKEELPWLEASTNPLVPRKSKMTVRENGDYKYDLMLKQVKNNLITNETDFLVSFSDMEKRLAIQRMALAQTKRATRAIKV
jgi:hypothetical protein